MTMLWSLILMANCEIIIALGFVEPHKLIEMVNMGIHRFVIKPLSVPKLAEAISKADKNQLAVILTETQKDGAKRMLDRLRSEFDCMDGGSCKIRFDLMRPKVRKASIMPH